MSLFYCLNMKSHAFPDPCIKNKTKQNPHWKLYSCISKAEIERIASQNKVGG